MLRDLILLILCLLLIGGGSWLALAGTVLAVFREHPIFAEIGAPAVLDRQSHWVALAAVLLGLVLFLVGASLYAQIIL